MSHVHTVSLFVLAAALTGAAMLFAGCSSAVPPQSAPAAQPVQDVTFYTEQFPPYNFAENGTLKGFSVDLLAAITTKTGSPVTPGQVRLVPWTEGYQTVLSRNNTAIFSTGRLPEREGSFKWAGPITSYATVLFARPDRQIVIHSPEDLKGYRIGVIRDAVGVRQLIGKGVNESQLVEETNASVLIDRLRNGEIDLWAYPEDTGRYLAAQQTGDPGTFAVVYTLPSLELWYAFNKDVPDATVRSFQQALDELKTRRDVDGLTPYDRIAAQYLRQTGGSPVIMTNPVAPIPLPSTDGINLAYELEITTPDRSPVIAESIEVIDAATGRVVYTPEAQVWQKTWQPASNPPPTAGERMNGTLKLSVPRISLWFKVRPDAVPDRLVHRLTLNRSASGLPPLTVTGGAVTVRKDLKPVVIGPPVKGSGWVVMETTLPTTHHFLMPVTINNVTTVDQRYAQDWFYIDPVNGSAAAGNATLARNFLGYGKELLAVADGTVVQVRDGVPENEIIYHKIPFAFETGTGNTVIIGIGNDTYAGYCHIVPGSIRVKAGDRVKEGDVIALLGNTGQSDIPHLHFEVVKGRPAIIGGEGYPFVFREYRRIADRINETELETTGSLPKYAGADFWVKFGDFVRFLDRPVTQKEMLQENWEVVGFP